MSPIRTNKQQQGNIGLLSFWSVRSWVSQILRFFWPKGGGALPQFKPCFFFIWLQDCKTAFFKSIQIVLQLIQSQNVSSKWSCTCAWTGCRIDQDLSSIWSETVSAFLVLRFRKIKIILQISNSPQFEILTRVLAWSSNIAMHCLCGFHQCHHHHHFFLGPRGPFRVPSFVRPFVRSSARKI